MTKEDGEVVMARAAGKWHNLVYLQGSEGIQIEAARQCKRCPEFGLNRLQVKVVGSTVSAQGVESRTPHHGDRNVPGIYLAQRKARIGL